MHSFQESANFERKTRNSPDFGLLNFQLIAFPSIANTTKNAECEQMVIEQNFKVYKHPNELLKGSTLMKKSYIKKTLWFRLIFGHECFYTCRC